MGPNADLRHTVAIDVMAQATVIAHLEVPRGPDSRGRIWTGTPTDLCSEEPQQETPPSVEDLRTRPIEEKPNARPNGAAQLVLPGVGTPIMRDVDFHSPHRSVQDSAIWTGTASQNPVVDQFHLGGYSSPCKSFPDQREAFRAHLAT